MRTSSRQWNVWRKPSRGTTRDSGFILVRGRKRRGREVAVKKRKRPADSEANLRVTDGPTYWTQKEPNTNGKHRTRRATVKRPRFSALWIIAAILLATDASLGQHQAAGDQNGRGQPKMGKWGESFFGVHWGSRSGNSGHSKCILVMSGYSVIKTIAIGGFW